MCLTHIYIKTAKKNGIIFHSIFFMTQPHASISLYIHTSTHIINSFICTKSKKKKHLSSLCLVTNLLSLSSIFFSVNFHTTEIQNYTHQHIIYILSYKVYSECTYYNTLKYIHPRVYQKKITYPLYNACFFYNERRKYQNKKILNL